MLWKWGSVDKAKYNRALKTDLQASKQTPQNVMGIFVGNFGVYRTTLNACECVDFTSHHGEQPCKHMVRLAIEAGLIDEEGRAPYSDLYDSLNDMYTTIAVASGLYHVFSDSFLTDSEYDLLKQKYARTLGDLNFHYGMTYREFIAQIPE